MLSSSTCAVLAPLVIGLVLGWLAGFNSRMIILIRRVPPKKRPRRSIHKVPTESDLDSDQTQPTGDNDVQQ